MPTEPCQIPRNDDDSAGLHNMIVQWVEQLQGAFARDAVVDGALWAVRLIFTWDLAAMIGHAGATPRFIGSFCLPVIQPGPVYAELIAKCGTLQRPEADPTELRTRDQLLNSMNAYGFNDIDGLALPFSRWQPIPLFNYPVLAMHPREASVTPLAYDFTGGARVG